MQRSFPRHLDSLTLLYEFAEEILEAHDMAESIRFPVHLAIVDHGGVEFDVTAVRPVNIDAPLEDRVPGGLGVYLIQNLVDTLEYEYQDGRGEVIFTKGSGNEDV
jgi:anti-sigma regulatory factor (Ser/Thr protein kinase)